MVIDEERLRADLEAKATFGAVDADAIDHTDWTGMLQVGTSGDPVVADVPPLASVPGSPDVRATETLLKGGKVVHRV